MSALSAIESLLPPGRANSAALRAQLREWAEKHPPWQPLVTLVLKGDTSADAHWLAANAAHNARLLRTVARLRESIRTSEPSFLPVKGVAWLLSLYPSTGVRPVADVDLLVKPETLSEIQHALGDMGFHRITPPRSAASTITMLRERDEPHERQVVELHTRPGHGHPPYFSRYRASSLWQTLREASYRGVRFSLLALEHALLWQCLHVHNRFSPASSDSLWLGPLCDLALFLQRYGEEVNWPAWVRTCRIWKLTLPVSFSLVMAQALIESARVRSALEHLAESPVSPFERVLFTAFTRGDLRTRIAIRRIHVLLGMRWGGLAISVAGTRLLSARHENRQGTKHRGCAERQP